MLRLLDGVRAVGGAIRHRWHFSLLLQTDRGRRHGAELRSDRTNIRDPRCLTGGGAAHLRRDALRGLDADAGVPLARRKHRDLIQELIDP